MKDVATAARVSLKTHRRPLHSALARGMESVAPRPRVAASQRDPATARSRHRRMLALALCARRVDGLIVVPTNSDHGFLVPEMEAGIPVVFADRPPGRIDADTVLSDNVGGARKGTAHLFAGGHRRIGYLGDNPGIFTARERYQGYLSAMSAAGLRIESSWVAMGTLTTASVRRVLELMLGGPEP